MTREDEIFELVREAAGDDDAFMGGLIALARRDALAILRDLRDVDLDVLTEVGWQALAAQARRLATATALVAGEEGGQR